MRILYWAELFPPHIGGVEKYAADLLAEMSLAGHECAVLTNSSTIATEACETIAGGCILRHPFRRAVLSRSPARIHALLKIITGFKKEFMPDVVHVHLGGSCAFFELLTRRNAGAAVTMTTVHINCSSPPRAGDLYWQMIRSSDRVIACSHFIRRRLLDAGPWPGIPIEVIPCGVAHPDVPPNPLPFDPPVALMMGRLSPEKGFDLALRALQPVCVEFPALRVLVAGDGSERRMLESLAGALGLAECTRFIGWVPPREIPSLINRATLLIVPSRQEAFGIVPVEAARQARPVVAAGVGGIQETVVHGETGLLVPDGSIEAMARGVISLLSQPDWAAGLGQNALKQLEGRYTQAFFKRAHIDLYRWAAERRAG